MAQARKYMRNTNRSKLIGASTGEKKNPILEHKDLFVELFAKRRLFGNFTYHIICCPTIKLNTLSDILNGAYPGKVSKSQNQHRFKNLTKIPRKNSIASISPTANTESVKRFSRPSAPTLFSQQRSFNMSIVMGLWVTGGGSFGVVVGRGLTLRVGHRYVPLISSGVKSSTGIGETSPGP